MYRIDSELKNLHKITDSRPHRYAMNGVCLQPRGLGGIATATDGRALVACSVETGSDAVQMIIPADAYASAFRGDRRRQGVMVNNGTPGKATLICGESEHRTDTVEGNYPPFDHCVATDEPDAVIHVNRDILVKLLSAMPTANECIHIGFYSAAETGPDTRPRPITVWSIGNAGPAIGVIMPIGDDPKRGLTHPTWVSTRTEVLG